MALCEEIQAEGILPFYFGFRDTWTCLAPWNSIAVDLAPADLCRQVNRGEANFTEGYAEVADKYLQLISYGPEDPIAMAIMMPARHLPGRIRHVSHRKLCGAAGSLCESGYEH